MKIIETGGFKSRVTANKPELTQHHRDTRSAVPMSDGIMLKWRRVMFSDESSFTSVELTAGNESGGDEENAMLKPLWTAGYPFQVAGYGMGRSFS